MKQLSCPKCCKALIIILRYPNEIDMDVYVMGVDTDGTDPFGWLRNTVTDSQHNYSVNGSGEGWTTDDDDFDKTERESQFVEIDTGVSNANL